MVDFAMVRKTYMYSPTLLARTKRHLLDMARRKNIGKKLIYLAIILLAGCIIGFEAYRMITSYIIEKSSDNKWPTHDLTSGQYSGSYDGIDISRHQGRIHWEELSNVKRLKFIYVKATEGTSIKDPWYEENIKNARKHQISVGSYHFLTKMPAVLQFENFRAVYDKEKQNLLPVVDAEDDGTKGLSKSEIQSLLKTFCKLCKSYYIHLLYIVVRVISKIILVQSLTATTFGLPVIIMNLFYQVNPIMISGSTADMVVCLEFGTGWILIDLPRIEVLTIYESTNKNRH